MQVGVPTRLSPSTTASDGLVRTVALCAGSGGSVLKGAKADVYLTGEMSHVSDLEAGHVSENTEIVIARGIGGSCPGYRGYPM